MSITLSLAEADAQALMDRRILGLEEAKRCWMPQHSLSGFTFPTPPDVPYSRECLEAHRPTHILVFGFSVMPDGKPFSVVNLLEKFGVKQNGVCFSSIGLPIEGKYEWATRSARSGWWLIREAVYPDLLGKSCIDCEAFAGASGWEVPYVADVVYAAIFWQLVTGERLLRHYCTWCADVLPDGGRIRVGYNQPRDGLHIEAHDPEDQYESRGLMPIVPPDLPVLAPSH